MDLRAKTEIPLFERRGYRNRQHLGGLAPRGGSVLAADPGFGALMFFDEVFVDPGARATIEAPEGFEGLVYILAGRCVMEDEHHRERTLERDEAVYLLLGGKPQYAVCNSSSETTLHVFVAAFAARRARPTPRSAVGRFRHDAAGVVWVATPLAEGFVEGSLPLESTARLGIATLDPGVDLHFGPALDRGLFVNVLEGRIELGPSFVDEGGDARLGLGSPVRMQGVTRARLVVADVPLGIVQQLR